MAVAAIMETHDYIELDKNILPPDMNKIKQLNQDLQMTLSTISGTSSLASPGDSGVQLLDSESEVTSVMSVSGIDIEANDDASKDLGSEKETKIHKVEITNNNTPENKNGELITKLTNQNPDRYGNISKSMPNYFDKFEYSDQSQKVVQSWDKSKKDSLNQGLSYEVFEMEHPIKNQDIMNVSLTSYELLDYTLQNQLVPSLDQMHVSLSEEVNENLKVSLQTPIQPIVEDAPIVERPIEEQIVFRRQRKKKSKSDTPKKRVSFHEDILNSTKIDDIHINHGFITHEPDVSFSFFQRGFTRKPDVVKGRYSWAAEGDAPYYEKPTSEREIKSDLYIQRSAKFSSTSSSSTVSTSSSIDEDSEENGTKKEPTLKQPKSSCLKKSKHSKQYIDTNIVQEEINNRKKKSDINLLDSNIFGSLKNILNFSTSVPLVERGVPEGQEDLIIFTSSHEARRKSCTNLTFKGFETIEPAPVKEVNKPNLKLTASEGFYPTYTNQKVPSNVILCDSNVYEHKGISYSYEYDKFQKSFEQQQQNRPKKASTVYQMIKELNFFRKKEPKEQTEEFEIIPDCAQTPSIEKVEEVDFNKNQNPLTRYASTSKMDWSDNETVLSSDTGVETNGRHLNSPKHKTSKNNHYSLSPFKSSVDSTFRNDEEKFSLCKSLQNMKPATSKSSLINRFLKNVTLKKMLDVKTQDKEKLNRKCLGLNVGLPYKFVYMGKDDLDLALEEEILKGKAIKKKRLDEEKLDQKFELQLKKSLFRSKLETVLKVISIMQYVF